jgi:hypothetical protein
VSDGSARNICLRCGAQSDNSEGWFDDFLCPACWEPEGSTEKVEGDWLAGEVECGGCGYRWVAVRPIDPMLLECPRCKQIAGSMPHDPDDETRVIGAN